MNILRYAIGDWLTVILARAIEHDVFIHLSSGARDASSLAGRAKITIRVAQGLLDGLLALGLVELSDGAYCNTIEAERYLTGTSLSDLRQFVLLGAGDIEAWQRLGEVAKTNVPLRGDEPAAWDGAVLGFAPLSVAAARVAAERLGVEARESLAVLDVGGGSGAFSAIWLSLNERARAVQIDWPGVNLVARQYVAGLGVSDRFETRDGDLHAVDFGRDGFDVVVLSLVLHFFAPGAIAAVLSKAHRALRPGGSIVVCDIMSSTLWSRAFQSNMLLSTRDGATHPQAQYEAWLADAGFVDTTHDDIDEMPHSVLISYRRPYSCR